MDTKSKRNLLFIIPGLAAGGGEKSLVNLLTLIDYSKYNVDLFLLNHEGLFMRYLPKEVNVLSFSKEYELFRLPLIKSIFKIMVKGNLSLLYNRLMFTVKNRAGENTSNKEQKSWGYLSKTFEIINKDYDVAIGFLEKTSLYFCVDKVKAKKKIGWIHNDYEQLGLNPEIDLKYFSKLNHIVTVSEKCKSVLVRNFPTEKDKITVIYNVVSPKIIQSMALDKHQPNERNNDINILTIGRLHYQKGLELAIEACSNLIRKGYKIKWDVIGEGEERGKLEQLIKSNNLEGYFNLLGLKSNPYPYLKYADLYVQPSRFEGKSIAIDEAKIFKKPILVTNFSTAKDQISNGINGIIVDMNSEAISKGLENLINNENIRRNLIKNLGTDNLGTEKEIIKVYKLLEDGNENQLSLISN